MKNSTRGIALALVLGVVFGAIGASWLLMRYGYLAGFGDGHPTSVAENQSVPKTQVEVAPVEQTTLARDIAAVGSLRSQDSVVLRPEISGRISQINFEQGRSVEKGQVLLRLDDSVTRAELMQAQANLSLARSQYHRAEQLVKQGFISKQARDEALSKLKVAQAAEALAQARQDKTMIRAPFDGVMGLRNVSVGDYVSPDSELVQLESLDVLDVDFRVPEQYFSNVHVGQKLVLSFDTLSGKAREGEVGAISPLLDASGRSILLRARVRNDDRALRPGMFARVRLQFSDDQALMIPEIAVAPAEDEQYVFRVVNGRVERISVKLGLRRGGRVEVVEGLMAGDMVVTRGLQNIASGDEVHTVRATTPPATAPAS